MFNFLLYESDAKMSKNYTAQTFEGPTTFEYFSMCYIPLGALHEKYFHNIRLISHQNVFFKYRAFDRDIFN